MKLPINFRLEKVENAKDLYIIEYKDTAQTISSLVNLPKEDIYLNEILINRIITKCLSMKQ